MNRSRRDIRTETVSQVPALPPRPISGHKGLFGRVLVVGGSEDMIGAPALAGAAALRMGAGVVQVAVPKAILNAVISITPELVGLGLGAPGRDLVQAAKDSDAVIVGPGMGQSAESVRRLFCLLRLEKPLVVDADALNLLSAMKKWPGFFKAPAVLTPHPGEMRRLARFLGRSQLPADDQGRVRIATKAAKMFAQVVVLKGERTVVTDGRRVYVNHTGNSSLSKAGTGDVLSGMIGTLLAQGMARFEAAVLGVHLHGRAGELAGEKLGMRCVLARDVIDAIPAVINEAQTTIR